MQKNNLTGWKNVFCFTVIQTLKSKAFIISYILLLVLVLVSMPIINMITSSTSEDINAINSIKKVYVNNQTAFANIDFSKILKDKTLHHITFEEMKNDYDDISDKIEESEKDSIILTITENEDVFNLTFTKSTKGSIKDNDMQRLANHIVEYFSDHKIKTLGITDEQLATINASITTKVSMTNVTGDKIIENDTSITITQYWVVYGILFIIFMVNIMASSQIATSIVTEKSTRVVEYMLTSVKPLALMVGKIIGMLSIVLLQMIVMAVVLFISNKISESLSSGHGESVLTQYLPKDIFQNLNMLNIVLCLLLIMLGMIFYATLAGLAGATVSRLEEMGEGLTLFTITNLIGFYIGLAAANVLMASGVNGYVTFALLFPLSSAFILPGTILVGKANMLLIGASIALQILFVILLFRFVANVYETLILHNGNKIKVKELIKLSKIVKEER